MKLLTAQQIKTWDACTIQTRGIRSIDLMEEAAVLCTEKLKPLLNNGAVRVLCGKGNNGGDGLVIARKLSEFGINVHVYVVGNGNETEEFATTRKRLPPEVGCTDILNEENIPSFAPSETIVDALLGTGINRPANGLMASVIDRANQSGAKIIAVDIPSGLPADVIDTTELTGKSIIRAHHTITFQIPKQSFLHPECSVFTGKIQVVDIGLEPSYQETITNAPEWVDIHLVKQNIKERNPADHKGIFGHGLMVAGSFGKLGAVVLASKAGLRAGCGLVTAFVPKVGFTVLQTALPEAMVQVDDELYEIRNFPQTETYSAVGVGPGLGTHEYTVKTFAKWIQQVKQPVVLDADALNISAQLLAADPHFRFPDQCILTPHPKEFDRMVGSSRSSFERYQKQEAFARKHGVWVVLKGANTRIVGPDGRVFYNSSGNVALATAGSGDVLTGIIMSLLAQQYPPEYATIIGVYLHGLCADIWVEQHNQTMIATDIIEMIPKAWYRIFA